MNCKKEWQREFVDNNFTKTFRTNELQKHRENVLCARERAMLAATIPLLEEQRRKVNVIIRINEKKASITKMKAELFALQRELFGQPSQIVERKLFYKPCPRTGCASLLSSRYRCTDEKCNTYVCSECDKLKLGFEDPTHVCVQDDIATVKLKAKECKRCPVCHVETFKSDGCDQVWCPPPCGSKTGTTGTQWLFSTGKIDKDKPHAPLYYEYMRRNNNGIIPRNAGDNGENNCEANGEMPFPSIRQVTNFLQRMINADITREIVQIHQVITHIKYNEINTLAPDRRSAFDKNSDLRIKILENHISDTVWKTTLQRREKADSVKNAEYELYHMFVQVGVNEFTKLINGTDCETGSNTFIEEMRALRTYFNECQLAIQKRFTVTVKLFECDSTWKRY